jgi:hypothetical protein
VWLTGGKQLEAFALFSRALERVGVAQERLQELPQPDAALQREQAQLSSSARAWRCAAHAELAAQGLAEQEGVQEELGGLSLGEGEAAQQVGGARAGLPPPSPPRGGCCCRAQRPPGQGGARGGCPPPAVGASGVPRSAAGACPPPAQPQRVPTHPPLATPTHPLAHAAATCQARRYLEDNLDAWESFAAAPGRPARVCRVPPPMQPVAFRPIMLDTASGAIQYPSLAVRLNRPEEGKSTFAKWMGW